MRRPPDGEHVTEPARNERLRALHRRPIATSLLAVAVLLGGLLGYFWLPVSSLPQVDFPTIQVTTQLPGANPDTMASLVTALAGAPARPDPVADRR